MQYNAADGLFTKPSTLNTRNNYCGLQAGQLASKPVFNQNTEKNV